MTKNTGFHLYYSKQIKSIFAVQYGYIQNLFMLYICDLFILFRRDKSRLYQFVIFNS